MNAYTKLPMHGGSSGVLSIDTGAIGPYLGVVLPPDRWRGWKAAHTNQPRSIIFGSGLAFARTLQEASWAQHLTLGPLQLTDVMISEADSAFLNLQARNYAGTLTFQALKRLDVIIDGEHGAAYLHVKRIPASRPTLLGCDAAFLPGPPPDELVAKVQPGNAAYQAGVRDGDILLKIGQADVKQWLQSPGASWRLEQGGPFLTASNAAENPREIELALKRCD